MIDLSLLTEVDNDAFGKLDNNSLMGKLFCLGQQPASVHSKLLIAGRFELVFFYTFNAFKKKTYSAFVRRLILSDAHSSQSLDQ